MSRKVIAIIGGIGAGKSVVRRILEVMGYNVYDSDSRARALMDCDKEIHDSLKRKIHPMAVVDGKIDRALISDVVFSDRSALDRLNSIVHGRVIEDFMKWMSGRPGSEPLFVETAILYQCDLWKYVDEVWEVTAPVQERIHRVIQRSGLTAQQVIDRINSQASDDSGFRHPASPISNDGLTPLLPQIHTLLNKT